VDAEDAGILADLEPPAWLLLTGPRVKLSSTALRQRVLKP
jgi:nicotinate-nucleotide adenylyltransferase